MKDLKKYNELLKTLTKETVEKEIRELLVKQFKGKTIDTYYSIEKSIREYLQEKGINTEHIFNNYKNQNVCINYYADINDYRLYWTFINIDIKKERNKDYSCRYYDWVYKDFVVCVCGESMQSIFENINKQIMEMLCKEETQKYESAKAIKELKTAFPHKSNGELRELISYLNKNKYSLID